MKACGETNLTQLNETTIAFTAIANNHNLSPAAVLLFVILLVIA